MGDRGVAHSRAALERLGYDPEDPVRGRDIPMMLVAVLARASVVEEWEIEEIGMPWWLRLDT